MPRKVHKKWYGLIAAVAARSCSESDSCACASIWRSAALMRRSSLRVGVGIFHLAPLRPRLGRYQRRKRRQTRNHERNSSSARYLGYDRIQEFRREVEGEAAVPGAVLMAALEAMVVIAKQQRPW
jgi:hypothetical protein